VGFSTSKNGLNHTDGTVAVDNYKALIEFFNKFPNLKKNDFYMSG
jgi:carboxypeptidase C (cathepsin A)